MPAFLCISNLRDFSLILDPEDIGWTNVCTNSTGITFLLDNDGWHNILLHSIGLDLILMGTDFSIPSKSAELHLSCSKKLG
jgi:hypothetical protein